MDLYLATSLVALLLAFAVAGTAAFVFWYKKYSNFKLITGLQGLVDKMKEYDLDARAGLIICRDFDLRIQYIDPALRNIFGCPTYVDELLPPSMRERHRQLVAPYIGRKPLPDSLNHPLRNVQILTKEEQTMQAKLIIGKFSNIIGPDICYVIVQPHGNPQFRCDIRQLCNTGSFNKPVIGLRKSASSHSITTSYSIETCSEISWQSRPYLFDFVEDGMGRLNSNHSRATSPDMAAPEDLDGLAEMYGLAAASYMDRGLVPATERYAQATVLYMDIVDFTQHCVAKQLDEISAWMTTIHTAVDELLERYAIRKVETRGDCVICVSGTNFVPTEGGASRDLCGDQATRMLSFGHDLGLALSAIDGTAARMGIATGPVVLTHIAHGGEALPAKYIYGDTVNVACRMEQTGRVGAVQLAESAARAYAEERGVAVPPLRRKEIKGKGAMRVALFDCMAGRFLDEDTGAVATGVRASCVNAQLASSF